jgi:hypothetical protein
MVSVLDTVILLSVSVLVRVTVRVGEVPVGAEEIATTTARSFLSTASIGSVNAFVAEVDVTADVALITSSLDRGPNAFSCEPKAISVPP